MKNHDLSARATMAVKLRLGEKEILERAVKSAAANREFYRRQMEERAPLPKYEESGGLLEGVADSRLPLVLRNLDGEAGAQEALTLTEAVRRAQAAEHGLLNGESSIPNGTRSEKETLTQEEGKRATGDAKEPSCDSAEGGAK